MGILDKALGAFGLQRKTTALTLRRPDGVLASAVGGVAYDGHAGELVTPRSALGLSAVWACANLISGTGSSLPHEIRRRGRDGVAEVADDHPLHSVVYESPNFDQTALDFWDFMNLSLELWGNAYASVQRQGDRVVALYPVQPDVMIVRRLENGRIEYRWTESGTTRVRLDRDVLHIRGPGGSPLGGMSTLAFGAHVFSSALAADRAAASTFKNGMRPSGILSFSEFLNEQEREIAQALPQKYVGAANSGRPFVGEGGVKFEPISISPEDAQMLQTRQFSVEDICRFFQVPPALIGHAGASTAWPTSVDQQVLMFVKFYLRRRIKRIEQAVTKQLLTAKDRAAGLSMRVNMDAMLRGDTSSRAQFYQTMTQIGAMTINDVCDIEGLPRKPGGDVPRMQMQNVPITATGEGANDDA